MIFANRAMLDESGLTAEDLDDLPCALVQAARASDEGSDLMVQVDLKRRGKTWPRVRRMEMSNGLMLGDWHPIVSSDRGILVQMRQPDRERVEDPSERF